MGIDCTISLLICRSALCPANKTKCPPPSSQCIDVTSQCDGRKDCYGGLDELQCGRCIVIVLQKHISLSFDETALGFQFINKCIASLFFRNLLHIRTEITSERFPPWYLHKYSDIHWEHVFCIAVKLEGKTRPGLAQAFNPTSKKWEPICSSNWNVSFSELLCKQLGYR